MAEVNVRVSDSGRLFPDAVVIKVDEQEIIAGQDGISPVVTVTEIGTAEAVSSHGYEVEVSDAAGVHTYSVYDGASAYAQAVAGGYSGTEEEFAADLIGFNTRAAEATAGATAAAAYADAASDSATAAATSESNAAGSATAAASSASEAASSAGTATTAAGSASSSATAAAGSATSASNKASEAASSESNAASSATAASASATAAAASETAAASSASSAVNSATAAAASAAAIEEYEHDAEAWAIGKRGGVDVDSSDDTYHNNSKYYAEQAAASSSTASSAASAAAQSATDAASEAASSQSYSRSSYISSTMASGSATAASEAQTAAETAAATAEGHATNAASSATAASGSATAAAQSATEAGNASTAATTAKEAAEDAQESAEALVQSIAQSAEQIAQNTSDIGDLKSAVNDPVTGLDTKAPIIINSASGAIASFADGAGNMPVKQLTVAIDPVQDLHGYDNPWPAGGTKNKMPNAIPKTETINGITFKLDEFGVFTVTGTATEEANCDFPIGYSFVIPDGDPKPKFALNNTQSSSAIFKFFNNSTQIDSWGITPSYRTAEYSGMRGRTCNSYSITVPSGAVVNMTISPMIVENSVTDYTYIPYSNICPISGRTSATIYHSGADTSDPTTYNIQLGDTVYGGTLDVVTGVLTVTMVANSNMDNVNWSYLAPATSYPYGLFYSNFSRKKYGETNFIMSNYKLSANYFRQDVACFGNGQANVIYIMDSRFNGDVTAFSQSLVGQTVCYELATPIEITLTPTQIDTLLGTNNIWADAGDVSVDYRADTKLYIDAKIAAAIAAALNA